MAYIPEQGDIIVLELILSQDMNKKAAGQLLSPATVPLISSQKGCCLPHNQY
jgi:hypothetical protein